VRLPLLALFLIASASVSSCGYSTGSLMPEGIRTVAVPMAGNDTFYRGDEFAYTRYLTEELIRKPGVQVRERRCADAVVCTRLLSLRRVPLVEGEDDILLEEGLVGVVEVTLTDRRSGRTLAQFKVERRAEGIRPRGETLNTERDELMRDLAEDTVIRLEGLSLLTARGYPMGTWDTRPAK
jgi:Lipopolysaccharide-assembly